MAGNGGLAGACRRGACLRTAHRLTSNRSTPCTRTDDATSLHRSQRGRTARHTPTCTRPAACTAHSKSQGMLDRSVQGQIGRMLRDVFVDVAEEPVPERFVKLLEALEAKEKQP